MLKIIGLALGFAASSAIYAANYQAQGCGLGSTIWTDGGSLMHQVLGTTTNGSTGNNTFGMTSGTSNCELDSSSSAKAIFIEANKVALANDISRGQGETMAALVRMYGCQNIGTAGSVLQKNFSKIFAEEKASGIQIQSNISKILENKSACI